MKINRYTEIVPEHKIEHVEYIASDGTVFSEEDDCPRYLTGRYKTLYKYTKTDGLSEAQIRKKMGIKKSTYERYMRKMNEMIRNYGG